jgi:zinc/manganese transport system substrate-binding protein
MWVGTYTYIREVVKQVGGDRVKADALSKGQWDPHYGGSRPSLIALVRKADLMIMNGAQLEIGWLPPLLQQANNPNVLPVKKGFLDLSDHFELIQKPDSISRAEGDIHPAGNPHFYLDPHLYPKMAELVADKLIELDPAGKDMYMKHLAISGPLAGECVALGRADGPAEREKSDRIPPQPGLFSAGLRHRDSATVELLPGIPPTTSM